LRLCAFFKVPPETWEKLDFVDQVKLLLIVINPIYNKKAYLIELNRLFFLDYKFLNYRSNFTLGNNLGRLASLANIHEVRYIHSVIL
jgi:hypothetical protein